MLKKCLSDKINVTKKTLFLLLRAPTHHSFTFSSQFLYELKQKVCLSESMCGIFHFQFRFVFISLYFCSTSYINSLTLNIIIPFTIKTIEKLRTLLLQDLRYFSCIKKF